MMTKTDILNDIKNLASQCDRCGSCNLVCPLFAISDIESASPRGRINAARALAQGGVIPEADILKAAQYCLLCGSCTQVCPSKIKTPTVMLKVREYLAQQAEDNLQCAIDEKVRQEAFDALCEACAEFMGSEPAKDNQVAYFFCCAAAQSLPTAIKSVKLLSTVADVELVNNAHCGLLYLLHGDMAHYREFIKQNIGLFADVDTIVCDCAACADALRYAAECFPYDEEAKEFSGKVLMLSEYLVKMGYVPQAVIDKITFHEHVRFGQNAGAKKAARQLLGQAGDFVELPQADVSCGCGIFATDYPEAAERLLAQKQANIEKTGATIVVTDCYSCLVRLQQAAANSGKFQARHISEII